MFDDNFNVPTTDSVLMVVLLISGILQIEDIKQYLHILPSLDTLE